MVAAVLFREFGAQTLLRLPSRKAGRGVDNGPMRRGKRYFYQSFAEEKTAVAGSDTLVGLMMLFLWLM